MFDDTLNKGGEFFERESTKPPSTESQYRKGAFSAFQYFQMWLCAMQCSCVGEWRRILREAS